MFLNRTTRHKLVEPKLGFGAGSARILPPRVAKRAPPAAPKRSFQLREGERRAVQRRDAGYTLTEMLVVLIIIGLIAAAVTPAIVGQLDRARVRTARLQLDTISAALEMLHADMQRYPTTEEGLAALLRAPPNAQGWLGPYVRNEGQIRDPWGRPLVYRADDEAGGAFALTSLGADGREGGEGVRADIALDASLPLAAGAGAKQQ